MKLALFHVEGYVVVRVRDMDHRDVVLFKARVVQGVPAELGVSRPGERRMSRGVGERGHGGTRADEGTAGLGGERRRKSQKCAVNQ